MRCSWKSYYKDLHVGDVVMMYGGPKILIKRVSKRVAARTYGGQKYTVHFGTFLHLMTGRLVEERLGGAEINSEIIWAPRSNA